MLRWLIFLSLMILYMIPVAALPQEHTKNRVLSLDGDGDYVEMAVISGMVVDESGNPVSNAYVYLKQNGETIIEAQTDAAGSYQITIAHPEGGQYDLFASKDIKGDMRLGISLAKGENQTINLKLKKAVSIEGKLLMLDDKTPHVALVVQAVGTGSGDTEPRPVATALTDENGKYKLINLKPGSYQIRCHVMDGYVYYRDGENFVSEQSRATPLPVKNGRTIENVDFRIAPFKKGTWKRYTPLNGLASMYVHDVHQSPDGAMWFASYSHYGPGSGVSRYDGRDFVTFTTKDGLVGNDVWTIGSSSDGVMWFGTPGGLSKYDGEKFTNFTAADGLAGNNVSSIYGGADDVIWVASGDARGIRPYNGGVSRYNGKNFDELSELKGKSVISIYGDPDGTMWFGTVGDGAYRYDGKEFYNINVQHGLLNNTVIAIDRGSDGAMWFGTPDGLSKYDGEKFNNLTSRDGLLSHESLGKGVFAIHSDPDGVMWFSTPGGVSRYDGKTFVNFTEADGLMSIWNEDIYRDSNGFLWFGTMEGGAIQYDDRSFSNLTMADGLPSNRVLDSHSDPDSGLWVGTIYGLAHYDTDGTGNYTPRVHEMYGVNAVCRDADGRLWFASGAAGMIFGQGVFRYDKQSNQSLVNFTTSDGLVSNNVTSIFSDSDGTLWFGTSAGLSRYDGNEFTNFTTGDAQVSGAVNDIYQDEKGVLWFATWGGVYRYDGIDLVKFTTQDGLAHGLVNSVYGAPDGVLWFGIFGGGVSRYDGNEFINFDTSHGLAGTTVDSIYYSESDGILWFGTVGGGVSNEGADTIQWSNAAQPLPMIKRGNEASEAEGNGELPLGMMADVAYSDYELRLGPGDMVILYTDGIIEAENEAEEMYGTERLVKCMADMDSTLRAEAMIEAIFQDVSNFMGSAQQYDDITMVVLKKL